MLNLERESCTPEGNRLGELRYLRSKEEVLEEIKEIRDLKRRVFVITQALSILEKERMMEAELEAKKKPEEGWENGQKEH